MFLKAVPLAAALAAAAYAQVLTQHNDNSRSGAALNETVLTTTNVKPANFGKLFTLPVDGNLYAQPLYFPALSINGGVHNVVYVATEHNTVYAYDADTASSTPLWQVSLGPSVPVSDLGSACTNVTPEVGITSTPVVDQSSGTIYVVAKTKELVGTTYQYLNRLHALDVTTGMEKFGGPVIIKATVAGKGDGGATVTFNSLLQLNRPGLILVNGSIYVAFASHCDITPYHGWVFGFDASTLNQLAVYITTPNGAEGGIWHAGQGMAADSGGNLYAISGNGTFDANNSGLDYGDTFLKLTAPGLKLTDWFTPSNQSTLNRQDQDNGTSGPLLISGGTRLVGGSKPGTLYVLDTANLGHYSNGKKNQIVQSFQVASSLFSSPAFWNVQNAPAMYVSGVGDFVKAYRFANGLFQTTPVSQSSFQATNFPGGILSLSANGNTIGTGILWVSTAKSDASSTTAGVLHALDASNLANELWNSDMNATRDAVGNFAKFCPPTIANGKVYLATFSGYVAVYGLLLP